jgi:hypothetical protein
VRGGDPLTLGRVDDEDRLLATMKNLMDAVIAIMATPAFRNLS